MTVININSVEELQKAVADNPTLLVDFWATWCGPCRVMGPILDKVSEEKNVVIAKVDVDSNPELSQMFNVMSIPTLYSFKDGEPAGKVIGAVSKKVVEDLVK